MLINLPRAQKSEHKPATDSYYTWQHSRSPLRKLRQGLSPQ